MITKAVQDSHNITQYHAEQLYLYSYPLPYSDSVMTALPIHEVLPDIVNTLIESDQLILEAPPGAGKTTAVPLALLDQPWLQGQKIMLLEPRRIAAKTAAIRMADMLGEKVGETVGYRVRMDNKVSQKTRIEVVTEGVLTRMMQQDPSLEGVALIVFDEFHERSLDADLALALTLQSRSLFGDLRDQALKILVMSATLDGESVQGLIEQANDCTCPIIKSEGRAYPVDIHWFKPSGSNSGPNSGPSNTQLPYGQRLQQQVSELVLHALTHENGSLLVFLPGQKEIQGVHQSLNQALSHELNRNDNTIRITPFYGALSLEQQSLAIRPAASGERKIVLTTNIAETSLTIEGIRVVVDSGLVRVAEYDPKSSMSRLRTQRVSKASAQQRMGRAGRTEAGSCYRLWSEEQHYSLANFTEPEIEHADLTHLVLQLSHWGITDPNELDWLTSPKIATYNQAKQLLQQLNALDDTGTQLTAHGQSLMQLPMHPRLGHLIMTASRWAPSKTDATDSTVISATIQSACHLAALLSDRAPDTGSVYLKDKLAFIESPSSAPKVSQAAFRRIAELSKQFQQQAHAIQSVEKNQEPEQYHREEQSAVLENNKNAFKPSQATFDSLEGLLTAIAYPDRIAKVIGLDDAFQQQMVQQQGRQNSGQGYLCKLANGRQAVVPSQTPLTTNDFLAIAELGGQAGKSIDRVFMAAPLDIEELERAAPGLFQSKSHIHWDEKSDRLVAEQQYGIGQLKIRAKPLNNLDESAINQALMGYIRKKGLNVLAWTDELHNWRARIDLLRTHQIPPNTKETGQQKSQWPDLTDQALLDTLEDWLAPYLNDVKHIKQLQKLPLKTILEGLLPWPLPQELNTLAPERFRVPSGSNIRIDYRQTPPVLAVKLQEMFGQQDTPSIANGRIKLLVHLLSPAQRPLQITQDLAGFWQNSYQDVKKDMKGRYPKHPWPEDPLTAIATGKTKARM